MTILGAGKRQLELATEEPLSTADLLSDTIDDVPTVAREDSAVGAAPADVVYDVAVLWRAPLAREGRRLTLPIQQTADVAFAAAALRQSLNALVDNAVRHGRGAGHEQHSPFFPVRPD